MDAERKAILEEHLMLARALRDTMWQIHRTNENDVWRFGSYQTFIRKYNALVRVVASNVNIAEMVDYFEEEKVLGPLQTIAMTQRTYFESVITNLNLLISILKIKIGSQEHELLSIRDSFKANLRRAIFTVPKREREIQDTVEQIMIGRGLSKGIDYDRESGRVKVSAKEAVPDFILIKYNLALEVKLLKDPSRRSELIDEINADIRAYSTKHQYLLFLIYDMGAIRDEAEFKLDLEDATNIFVEVVKH
jgi:REase_DpnII-MboI